MNQVTENISLTIEPGKDLTIFTLIGKLEFKEFMTVYKKFYDYEPTKNVLFDATKGSLEPIKTHHIEAMADYLKANIHKRPTDAKTAFVVQGQALNYGLVRMHQIFSEIRKITLETKIFESLKDAMGWF